VRLTRLVRDLLGVEDTLVVGVIRDPGNGDVVISVRPKAGRSGRCGVCHRRCPGYDRGPGRRRWRSLDLGTMRTWLEGDTPRVRCREHGVVVAAVPWARHGARHTFSFDQTAAWLVRNTSKSAVSHLLRIAWVTVGAIVSRVVADADAAAGDRLAGVRRIGIDEISYRRGHKYLTVVVDHDTGALLWVKDGRTKRDLAEFFDKLGEQRCAEGPVGRSV
jgi:transposase